jgi:hypothetical protein
MFKFRKAFKNSYQGVPLPKFQKAVKDILKYGKMSVPEAKKFQAEKQISADSKRFADVLGDDKIRPKDLNKILGHSCQQKTFEKWQADRISGYLKKGGFSKIETAPKTQEPAKARKPSRLEAILEKTKKPKISPNVLSSKISGEASKQGMPGKKTSESDKTAKEAKRFKASKSEGPRVAFAVPVAYDFSGRGQKLDTTREQPDREPPLEIPDWKLEAYDKKMPGLSKPSHSAESEDARNKDIDD